MGINRIDGQFSNRSKFYSFLDISCLIFNVEYFRLYFNYNVWEHKTGSYFKSQHFLKNPHQISLTLGLYWGIIRCKRFEPTQIPSSFLEWIWTYWIFVVIKLINLTYNWTGSVFKISHRIGNCQPFPSGCWMICSAIS